MPFKRPPIGMVMQGEPFFIQPGLRQRQELDATLVQLFEQALNADPSQRPTAAELAKALAARSRYNECSPSPISQASGRK
jgi:hypothetical protein